MKIIFESEASHMWTKTIKWMNKKLAPLRAKNDVTHAIQRKLYKRMNNKQIKSDCDVKKHSSKNSGNASK